MSGGGDTPTPNTKIKIAQGGNWFVGEIRGTVFRPFTMSEAVYRDMLWIVNGLGKVENGSEQTKFTPAFQSYLEGKITQAGYEITGSQVLAVDLTAGEEFRDLDAYESIT